MNDTAQALIAEAEGLEDYADMHVPAWRWIKRMRMLAKAARNRRFAARIEAEADE